MDEMNAAYKKVLTDLMKDMQRRMVEGGAEVADEPVDVAEAVEESLESEPAETCEGCEKLPCGCPVAAPVKKGMTISLSAIKKQPKPVAVVVKSEPVKVESKQSVPFKKRY